MLEESIERIAPLIPPENILVATNELLKSIRDRNAGEMVRMPYSLQLRKSIGPVPAARGRAR